MSSVSRPLWLLAFQESNGRALEPGRPGPRWGRLSLTKPAIRWLWKLWEAREQQNVPGEQFSFSQPAPPFRVHALPSPRNSHEAVLHALIQTSHATGDTLLFGPEPPQTWDITRLEPELISAQFTKVQCHMTTKGIFWTGKAPEEKNRTLRTVKVGPDQLARATLFLNDRKLLGQALGCLASAQPRIALSVLEHRTVWPDVGEGPPHPLDLEATPFRSSGQRCLLQLLDHPHPRIRKRAFRQLSRSHD